MSTGVGSHEIVNSSSSNIADANQEACMLPDLRSIGEMPAVRQEGGLRLGDLTLREISASDRFRLAASGVDAHESATAGENNPTVSAPSGASEFGYTCDDLQRPA